MDTREKIRRYKLYQAEEWELEESNRLRAQRQHWLPAREWKTMGLMITQDIEKEPWPEPFAETVEGKVVAIGGLPRGTSDGKPAVVIRANLSDRTYESYVARHFERWQAADASPAKVSSPAETVAGDLNRPVGPKLKLPSASIPAISIMEPESPPASPPRKR